LLTCHVPCPSTANRRRAALCEQSRTDPRGEGRGDQIRLSSPNAMRQT